MFESLGQNILLNYNFFYLDVESYMSHFNALVCLCARIIGNNRASVGASRDTDKEIALGLMYCKRVWIYFNMHSI